MFVTNILAARLLSQEIFGQFTMIRSTVNMGNSFISSANGLTAAKSIAEFKNKNSDLLYVFLASIFFVNIFFLILIALILFFFSNWIVNSFFLGNTSLINALYIGLFILGSSTFSTLIQNFLIGFEQYKAPAFISLFISLISLPIIFFLIKFFGLFGALYSVGLYFFLDFFLKGFYLKNKYHFSKTKLDFSALLLSSKRLLTFSLPLTISIMVNAFSFWYARTIVIRYSNGFSDLAIFDAAYQWLTIIMLITGATTSVALPMLAKSFGNNKENTSNRIFNINLIVNIGIAFFIASLFIFFSEEIMSLYGTTYIKGYPVLIILSLTSVLFSISSIFNKYMIATNHIWIVLFASIVGMIILFMTLHFLTQNQAIRLAWAFFSFYFSTAIVYIIARKILLRRFSFE